MSSLKDLTGQRFGRLIVESVAYFKNGLTYWNCVCDCGKNKIVYRNHLISGKTKSCGCFALEKSIERIKKLQLQNKKYNIYRYNFKLNCLELKLSNKNIFAQIDIKNYNKVKNFCWRGNNKNYISTNIRINGEKRVVHIHNLIMDNNLKNMVVDHIDRNPLNNKLSNLRMVTLSENSRNKPLPKINKTGYRNILFSKNKKLIVSYAYQKVHYYVGSFNTIEQAQKELLLHKKKTIDSKNDLMEIKE
jgi:hypothetical protein